MSGYNNHNHSLQIPQYYSYGQYEGGPLPQNANYQEIGQTNTISYNLNTNEQSQAMFSNKDINENNLIEANIKDDLNNNNYNSEKNSTNSQKSSKNNSKNLLQQEQNTQEQESKLGKLRAKPFSLNKDQPFQEQEASSTQGKSSNRVEESQNSSSNNSGGGSIKNEGNSNSDADLNNNNQNNKKPQNQIYELHQEIILQPKTIQQMIKNNEQIKKLIQKNYNINENNEEKCYKEVQNNKKNGVNHLQQRELDRISAEFSDFHDQQQNQQEIILSNGQKNSNINSKQSQKQFKKYSLRQNKQKNYNEEQYDSESDQYQEQININQNNNKNQNNNNFQNNSEQFLQLNQQSSHLQEKISKQNNMQNQINNNNKINEPELNPQENIINNNKKREYRKIQYSKNPTYSVLQKNKDKILGNNIKKNINKIQNQQHYLDDDNIYQEEDNSNQDSSNNQQISKRNSFLEEEQNPNLEININNINNLNNINKINNINNNNQNENTNLNISNINKIKKYNKINKSSSLINNEDLEYDLNEDDIDNEDDQSLTQNNKKIQIVNFNNLWIENFLDIPKIKFLLIVQDLTDIPINIFDKIQPNMILQKPSMPTKQQLEQRKQQVILNKKMSKFHNKTKLFINCLIKFFTKENLQKLQLPQQLQNRIFEFIENVRITGIKLSENGTVKKSDIFNNSHLRLLFLNLIEFNMNQLKGFDYDVLLHQTVFGINIKPETYNQDKQKNEIKYATFLKQCVYHIINQHLRQDLCNSPQNPDQQQSFANFNQKKSKNYNQKQQQKELENQEKYDEEEQISQQKQNNINNKHINKKQNHIIDRSSDQFVQEREYECKTFEKIDLLINGTMVKRL